MNIIEEINKLPNFGYVFLGDDLHEHIAVLGISSSKKSDVYEQYKDIAKISYEMTEIYKSSNLSKNEKIKLAMLMQEMYSMCDTRKDGLFTIDEQKQYLSKRSKLELEQIEQQVKMHLDCQKFYRDNV